jgi:hypothetical protein
VARDLRCPNPGCSHVFPAAAVAGMAALVCPKCGGVFQVKAKQPGPAAPTITTPQESASRSPGVAWLVAGLIVFLGIGLTTAAVYRPRQPAPPSGPEPYRSTEHNYSLRPPAPAWQQDDDLAKRLGGVLAFRRENPEARVVLCVRDYPKYVPSAGELREDAVARLRKLPVENLQREDKPEGGAFGGKPTNRFVFQGSIDGTIVSGDVESLFHQGKAYWLFRWCPTAVVDQVAGDLAELTACFSLLDLRPDWQPPRRHFLGAKVKYVLTAEGDRWENSPFPPESFDPAADLALIGKPDRGPNDATRQAQLLLLLLPAGEGKPMERAKSHLLARQKDLYPETTLAETPVAAGGQAPNNTLALRVANTKARERFVVLRVVPRLDRLLVLWAECDFARRDLWEADFLKLAGSLKLPG